MIYEYLRDAVIESYRRQSLNLSDVNGKYLKENCVIILSFPRRYGNTEGIVDLLQCELSNHNVGVIAYNQNQFINRFKGIENAHYFGANIDEPKSNTVGMEYNVIVFDNYSPLQLRNGYLLDDVIIMSLKNRYMEKTYRDGKPFFIIGVG